MKSPNFPPQLEQLLLPMEMGMNDDGEITEDYVPLTEEQLKLIQEIIKEARRRREWAEEFEKHFEPDPQLPLPFDVEPEEPDTLPYIPVFEDEQKTMDEVAGAVAAENFWDRGWNSGPYDGSSLLQKIWRGK
jgi:hypothetical protein